MCYSPYCIKIGTVGIEAFTQKITLAQHMLLAKVEHFGVAKPLNGFRSNKCVANKII